MRPTGLRRPAGAPQVTITTALTVAGTMVLQSGGKTGRRVDSRKRAQQLTVEQICALAGGPCYYTGRGMRDSFSKIVSPSSKAVRVKAERESIPIYQFDHKERKDEVANQMRRLSPNRKRGLSGLGTSGALRYAPTHERGIETSKAPI